MEHSADGGRTRIRLLSLREREWEMGLCSITSPSSSSIICIPSFGLFSSCRDKRRGERKKNMIETKAQMVSVNCESLHYENGIIIEWSSYYHTVVQLLVLGSSVVPSFHSDL